MLGAPQSRARSPRPLQRPPATGSTHLGLDPEHTRPSQHSSGRSLSLAPHCCDLSPSTPHSGGAGVGLAVGKGSTHKGLTPAAQTSPGQQTAGRFESVAPHCCDLSPSTPHSGGAGVGLAVGKGSTHKELIPAAQTRPGQHETGRLEFVAPQSWARSPSTPQVWVWVWR